MSKSPFPLAVAAFAVAAFAVVLALATQPSAAAETTVAEQYRILLDQYETEGGTRLFAKRFLALAAEHPDDPASVDALIWVVSKVRGNSDTEQAIGLLLKHHVRSSKLAPACEAIAASRCGTAESLLRAILEKNPDKEVQARASYGLALLLDGEANVVAQLKSQPELAPRILQYYGEDYGQHLLSLDPATLLQQREEIYARMLQSFPDIRANGTTLGKIAETALFAIRHLSVGKSAPEIAGQDIHGKPLKLSDFRGKVVMLSFWGHW